MEATGWAITGIAFIIAAGLGLLHRHVEREIEAEMQKPIPGLDDLPLRGKRMKE